MRGFGACAWERWGKSAGTDTFMFSFTNAKSRQKPLSIIYFKINANEVLSRRWPSFTIKSDLFRKDLWCRFPSNGGAVAVTLQLGMQFVIGSGGLTWFASIRAGWERGPGPRPRKMPSRSSSTSLPCDPVPWDQQKSRARLRLALRKGDSKAMPPEVQRGHLFCPGLSRARAAPHPTSTQRCRRPMCFLKCFRVGFYLYYLMRLPPVFMAGEGSLVCGGS